MKSIMIVDVARAWREYYALDQLVPEMASLGLHTNRLLVEGRPVSHDQVAYNAQVSLDGADTMLGMWLKWKGTKKVGPTGLPPHTVAATTRRSLYIIAFWASVAGAGTMMSDKELKSLLRARQIAETKYPGKSIRPIVGRQR